ncbi:integrase [Marinicella pacifica]|uniref:Integrase n=1 Tax=Marinicella pacifica TaxID=1171543 RepID=A0A917CIW9_9GAMM|nr:site-specific tyrosine recombinase/integron integrase [Marinicella pacifica]GGF89102.1 integrase [Marinicella pacifica]
MKKQEIISRFVRQARIENYSEATVKNYVSALRLFLDYVSKSQVEKISDDDIHGYLYYCKREKKYAYSSMKQVLATIRFLYAKVFHRPVSDALDIKLRKPVYLPSVLSSKDISKLIKVTDNLKHKTILLLIYSGGLRLSELLNLKVGDIDSQSMRIHVRQAKGKKDRYIMLSENVLTMLRSYYTKYKPSDYLVEGQKGGKYSPTSVQSVFKTALKKSGIKKSATVHSLRHSFATHLLDEGTDIRYIQELLGHKRLETTQIYTHVSSHSINKIKSPADFIDL